MTGTAAKKKRLGGNIFGSATCQPKICLMSAAGLSGLVFEAAVGGTARAPIHRYRFPPQETELRGAEVVHAVGGAKLGKAVEISIEEGWVDIKKRKDTVDLHPEALFAHDDIDTKVLAEALVRVGEHVADHGLDGEGPYQAARDLLLRHAPRVRWPGVAPSGRDRLDGRDFVWRCALDGGVLANPRTARFRQDLHRGAHDYGTCKRRVACRRDRQQPQGDSQPS